MKKYCLLIAMMLLDFTAVSAQEIVEEFTLDEKKLIEKFKKKRKKVKLITR